MKEICDALIEKQVELVGDAEACALDDRIAPASEEDFYTEYNALKMSVKIVSGIDEAIPFINEHSTSHSEAIVTEDEAAGERFLREIDSACVYKNASTRFSDGFEFGFGAEMGISTHKTGTARLICTPKVGQTFGGAYFHGKKRKQAEKV